MPSHIFTRVGAWEESVATNRRSADVAKKAGNEADEAYHATDYMVYALAAARTRRRGAARDRRGDEGAAAPALPRSSAPYAAAAMPARYAVERGDWAGRGAAAAAGHTYPVRRGDHPLRPRARRRAHGRRRCRRAGRRSSWRRCTRRCSTRRTTTGRPRSRCSASPRPAGSRWRKGSPTRRCKSDARRRRPRGPQREAHRHARPHRAGARAARRHADRVEAARRWR